MCQEEVETTDCILLHCDKVETSIRETFLMRHDSFVGRRQKVYKGTPLCIFWIILNERNNRLFEMRSS